MFFRRLLWGCVALLLVKPRGSPGAECEGVGDGWPENLNF